MSRNARRMPYSQTQSGELRELKVAFVNSELLTAEELEDEEDDDEEDDYDFNPNTLSSKPPPKKRVTMRILDTGQELLVKCRLPWTWSWLQATVRVKYPPTKRFSCAQQMIDGLFSVQEYHLEPGSGERGRTAINMLLSDIVKYNKQKKEDSDDGQSMPSWQTERNEFGAFLRRQPPPDCHLGKI